LQSEEQIPFQNSSVNNIYDDIGMLERYVLSRDDFFHAKSRERVNPGQINNQDFLSLKIERAFGFLDGFSRPIANDLA
jgi:hypothetical protein